MTIWNICISFWDGSECSSLAPKWGGKRRKKNMNAHSHINSGREEILNVNAKSNCIHHVKICFLTFFSFFFSSFFFVVTVSVPSVHIRQLLKATSYIYICVHTYTHSAFAQRIKLVLMISQETSCSVHYVQRAHCTQNSWKIHRVPLRSLRNFDSRTGLHCALNIEANTSDPSFSAQAAKK